jgi:hypothetical protein
MPVVNSDVAHARSTRSGANGCVEPSLASKLTVMRSCFNNEVAFWTHKAYVASLQA